MSTIELPKSEGFRQKSNLCLLAITADPSIPISSTYILFLTKLQKKANPRKKDLPLLENDITSFTTDPKTQDNCIYQRLDIKKGRAITDPARLKSLLLFDVLDFRFL